jgi:hypothetical protein
MLHLSDVSVQYVVSTPAMQWHETETVYSFENGVVECWTLAREEEWACGGVGDAHALEGSSGT